MQFSPWVKGITVQSEGSSGNDIWRDQMEKTAHWRYCFLWTVFANIFYR